MLKQHFSPNVDRVVRLSQADGTAHVRRADDREGGPLNPARAPWLDFPEYTSHPEVPVAEADRAATSLWRTALAPFMEGFAIHGASLHPTAAFPVQALQTSENIRQQRRTGNQQCGAHEHAGSEPTENSDAFELERAAWAYACSSRHWNWLGSLVEPVVTFWTYWRRKREIKKAVAVLAQYDDRTLRDLGICGRSDIERMVRYCRDC